MSSIEKISKTNNTRSGGRGLKSRLFHLREAKFNQFTPVLSVRQKT